MPGIIDVFLHLAKKYDVGVRLFDRSLIRNQYSGLKAATVFEEGFYDENININILKKIITSHHVDSLEVMCHPAFIDSALYNGSPYNLKRMEELNILTSDEIKGFIKACGFELCSLSDL
jgi:predicted glycoside hydrolase/deacetylase ChbG (UPF0249 family)